jgi:hypothetical protein
MWHVWGDKGRIKGFPGKLVGKRPTWKTWAYVWEIILELIFKK